VAFHQLSPTSEGEYDTKTISEALFRIGDQDCELSFKHFYSHCFIWTLPRLWDKNVSALRIKGYIRKILVQFSRPADPKITFIDCPRENRTAPLIVMDTFRLKGVALAGPGIRLTYVYFLTLLATEAVAITTSSGSGNVAIEAGLVLLSASAFTLGSDVQKRPVWQRDGALLPNFFRRVWVFEGLMIDPFQE
jgi:hypothetical protein